MFRQNSYLAEHLGSPFCAQWYSGKMTELSWFESLVTQQELA
ncbi:hypothetical protein [Kosakonia arachidis]|nr:hypothetical protein [Kosakonia arachidis]